MNRNKNIAYYNQSLLPAHTLQRLKRKTKKKSLQVLSKML